MLDLRFLKLLIFFVLISCQTEKNEQFFLIQGEAQGSTYSIKYIATEEVVSKTEIDSLLTAFDNSLSTYKPTSLISSINQGDSIIVVDNWFVETFKASNKIYKETNGLFDPTIGVLVNAYGFGPNHQRKHLNQNQIDSLLNFVGFNKVTLNSDKTISKKHQETYFDFNAIAQGYSVDVVAEFLQSKGIQNAIVEIGGELVGFGTNTIQNKNWIVGIDDPLQKPDEARKLIETVQLKNLGLATSGNYRKVITNSVTGEKFVHTINPKTGKPQKSNVLSATVIAPTCIMADGYATAFMVMSLEEGKEFVEKHPELYVLILYSDENNQMQRFQSDNIKTLMN
ncbi:FAD:protein FMN transferase [Flavobacterium okayamense]|uniref:FAD:protein FMN transferase n=1 Tax=Flavobacterium okayamense TaxID=2830782 RepID=A0ABN6HX64_9FLAO|nr:FAD:protein FMN transferase [Flavobacterium okayamense]BCY27416.1 FAD:protein FMN transferase [Flavobacterium okayamense]